MTNRVLTMSLRNITLIELLLTSAFVGALVHFSYFELSSLIWRESTPLSLDKFTAWTRPFALERDGMEVYALYIATFFQGILLISLIKIIELVKVKQTRIIILFALTIHSGIYFYSIGFHPPMSNFGEINWLNTAQLAYNLLLGLAIIGMIFYLIRNQSTVTNIVTALILAPVCFISTGPAYLPDYGYIFAPALQILNNIKFNEIYFQYDLLLSLVATLTLHLDHPIEFLQFIGQATLILLFFGIFIFSKKLFISKQLSVPLLICIVVIRIYAGEYNILASFQVTPLRLDTWFILLLSIHLIGSSHWLTGLTLSLLIFFHRNFGIIYFIAYCQLIATKYYFQYRDSKKSQTEKYNWFRIFSKDLFVKYRINLLLIFIAFTLALTLLGDNGAYRYQKIGIGFLRIAYSSFFWYIALLLTTTFALLIDQRNFISAKYFETSCFLIFLAVGNSLYFFGRSHENNIINISVIYVIVLFVFIDLAKCKLSHLNKANLEKYEFATTLGSWTVVAFIFIIYASSITDKIGRQVLNLTSNQFIYSNPFSKQEMNERISSIRSVTKNSEKIYFISSIDYLYYYHGNYKLVGYYNPFLSWTFEDEMIAFLNGLIHQGFFIVIDNTDLVRESMPLLEHKNLVGNGKFWILWR